MTRFQILEDESAETQRSSLEAAEPDKGSAASLFVAPTRYPRQLDRQHLARSTAAAPHDRTTRLW